MNKYFFLSACILCTMAAHSQTRLIALKSHSGSAANYRTESFGNFGIIHMPEVRLEKVEKLNDSTVVLTNRMTDEYVLDTIMHHPQFSAPGVTEKELRELYNNKVQFENFPKKPENVTPVPPTTPTPAPKQEVPVSEPETGPKNDDDRRNTLLLLVIGGGTFLGTGLIAAARRRKKAVATYA